MTDTRRAVVVCLILIAATAVSVWLGDGHGARRAATVAVLLVALAKVRLVGRHFMGLRTAPLALRAAFAGWLVLIGGLLIGMYLHAG
jgi:Prokaryotic Cytochrome C oxidase subunit IV